VSGSTKVTLGATQPAKPRSGEAVARVHISSFRGGPEALPKAAGRDDLMTESTKVACIGRLNERVMLGVAPSC
jgi:hypothetical protein